MKLLASVFWARVADAHLFTWGYLGFHVFAMLSMRLFLNSENLVEFLNFWISIFFIEHVFVFALYGLAKRFISRHSASLVMLGSLAVGTLRTLITTSLAIAVGADTGVAWQYQLLLGALYELMLVVLWANLNGAYRDHSRVVKQLKETKDSILGYRENAEEILADEQEKLIELTRSTLLPQIKLIENAIGEGSTELASRWGVAQELKGLIYNQVRPLSDSLRSTAKSLREPPKATRNHLLSVISIPKKFRIKNSIFPIYTFLAIFLGFLATPFWLLDISWVIPSALLSITYLGVIAGFKYLFRNVGETSGWVGIPVLTLMAVFAALPTYLVAVMFYPDTHMAVVYGSSLVYLSVIVVGILALLDSFDFEARLYRQNLSHQNEELAYEVALFEQQLWVARKNWSLVIHGTVQASLTAALTRLNAPDADKKTLDLARKDLERAIAALSNPPAVDIKFTPAIKEIVSTWQGVCDIDLEIHADVKKLVNKDSRLIMCLNEIVKEAISNAVRHGDARTAQVAMTLADDGVIDLTVTNDGHAPRIGGRRGLGSSLLDELTVAWSLGFDDSSSQTKLHARLPFSRA